MRSRKGALTRKAAEVLLALCEEFEKGKTLTELAIKTVPNKAYVKEKTLRAYRCPNCSGVRESKAGKRFLLDVKRCKLKKRDGKPCYALRKKYQKLKDGITKEVFITPKTKSTCEANTKKVVERLLNERLIEKANEGRFIYKIWHSYHRFKRIAEAMHRNGFAKEFISTDYFQQKFETHYKGLFATFLGIKKALQLTLKDNEKLLSYIKRIVALSPTAFRALLLEGRWIRSRKEDIKTVSGQEQDNLLTFFLACLLSDTLIEISELPDVLSEKRADETLKNLEEAYFRRKPLVDSIYHELGIKVLFDATALNSK